MTAPPIRTTPYRSPDGQSAEFDVPNREVTKMSIGKVCSRIVHTAELGETARAAAARMKQNNVGTLLVLGAGKRPVGILTDRDLVVRVMAEGRPPAEVRIEDVMTHHPRTLAEHTSIQDALSGMRQLGVRRLPVVGERGELVGILSIDDVLELLAGELSNVSRVVAHSTAGAVAPAPGRPVSRRATGDGLERASGDPEC